MKGNFANRFHLRNGILMRNSRCGRKFCEWIPFMERNSNKEFSLWKEISPLYSICGMKFQEYISFWKLTDQFVISQMKISWKTAGSSILFSGSSWWCKCGQFMESEIVEYSHNLPLHLFQPPISIYVPRLRESHEMIFVKYFGRLINSVSDPDSRVLSSH